MVYNVFVSYASKDREVADAVCAILEGRGIRCWIAPRDILPGATWAEAISDAIAATRLTVVVFSTHANRSPQVLREVERSVAKGRTIIPFRIRDVPFSKSLDYFLSTCQWFDALTPPLEPHINRLGSDC